MVPNPGGAKVVPSFQCSCSRLCAGNEEGSLPDDYEGGEGSSARLEEVESPVRTTDDQPTDARPFPEKRKVLFAGWLRS